VATIHDMDEVEMFFRERRIERDLLRGLRNDFYKKHLDCHIAVQRLPEEWRAPFRLTFPFHPLTLAECQESRQDGTTKLVLSTGDGELVETVVLRMSSGRTSLCLSTQIGCAAGCVFCATGKLGLRRNLEASEILDQLALANRLLAAEGRRLRNVMFMGMGEPFHNLDAVEEAIAVMLSPACFAMSPRRLLISTFGIPDTFVSFAQAHPQVRLALSLHSARQEIRARLMPVAARHSLADLREAILEAGRIQGQDTMLEYAMLAGVNDTQESLGALMAFVRGLPAWVNLIEYNPLGREDGLQGSEEKAFVMFEEELKQAGIWVTRRRSLGRGIDAACGQLARATRAGERGRATTRDAGAVRDRGR
jgi:23S rRNA (adenine2503-C2)-methyltransferase